MPYGKKETEYAKCPRCGKVAYGREQIDKEFGYRNMGNGNIIPQSHCRRCRSEESKDRY